MDWQPNWQSGKYSAACACGSPRVDSPADACARDPSHQYSATNQDLASFQGLGYTACKLCTRMPAPRICPARSSSPAAALLPGAADKLCPWRQHLLWEAGGSYELQGLHLPKVSGVAQHVEVQQLGHIPVPVEAVLLLESSPQGSRLFGHHIPLLSRCLGLPDSPDEIPASRALVSTPGLHKALHSLPAVERAAAEYVAQLRGVSDTAFGTRSAGVSYLSLMLMDAGEPDTLRSVRDRKAARGYLVCSVRLRQLAVGSL